MATRLEEHHSFFAGMTLASGGRAAAGPAGHVEAIDPEALVRGDDHDYSAGSAAAANCSGAAGTAGNVQHWASFNSLALQHDAAAAACTAAARGLTAAGSRNADAAGHHQEDAARNNLDRASAIAACGARAGTGAKRGASTTILEMLCEVVVVLAACATRLATNRSTGSALAAVTGSPATARLAPAAAAGSGAIAAARAGTRRRRAGKSIANRYDLAVDGHVRAFEGDGCRPADNYRCAGLDIDQLRGHDRHTWSHPALEGNARAGQVRLG